MEKKKSRSMGIASLVCGILANLLCLMPYLGLPLSICAVVFAAKQHKQQPMGIATAGQVLGIIGIVINGVLLLIVGLFILAYLGAGTI